MDSNYTKMDNTLLEAIYKKKFTAVEIRTILLVSRYTFGFHRESHSISISFIAKALNCSSRYISKALNQLVKKNVLIIISEYSKNKSRELKINKEYCSWIVDDLEDTSGDDLENTSGDDLHDIQERNIKKYINKDIDLDKNIKSTKSQYRKVADF